MRPGHRTSPRLSLQESLYCCTHDTNRILEIRRAWISPMSLFFLKKFIYLFILLYFTILYWFCHTATWICHGCTRVPTPEPPPTSLPIPSLWVIPVHQPQASGILHRTWTGDSFLIWYYTCFNVILPNHPPSLSHRVQKTVLYICLFCCLAYITYVSYTVNTRIKISNNPLTEELKSFQVSFNHS